MSKKNVTKAHRESSSANLAQPDNPLTHRDVVAAFLVGLADMNRELFEHRRFSAQVQAYAKLHPDFEKEFAEFQRKRS